MHPVKPPVDITDARQFPEIARALAHAASLTPERKKELWK